MYRAPPTTAGSSDSVDLANRKAIPPFAALRAFEAVGRFGGVRRAALALGLDHAVISRHLRLLESWLGVRLMDRMHAGACLTAEGRAYHARVSAALAEIAGATFELSRASKDKQLSVWCIPGFASQWLLSRLGDFRAHYPGIEIEVHPTDFAPDFKRYEADADVRFVTLDKLGAASTGIHLVEIARPLVFPVMSPQLASRLGPSGSVGDLLRMPLLHEDSSDEWSAWFAANDVHAGPNIPGTRLWHAHLTLDAARRGEGVALANPFLLGDDLDSGRLVQIGLGRPVVLGAYCLFCRKDRAESPATLRFQRWLQNAAVRTRQAA